MMRRLLGLLVLAGLAISSVRADSALPPGYEPLQRFPQARVIVHANGKKVPIRAWVADTPRRSFQGLMYIRSLDPDRGMLFLYPEAEYRSFWMRNTYVSLDILYIDADRRVINIAERVKPLSDAPIPSTGPAQAVLELVAGSAERLGIKPGDRIEWPAHVKPR